MIITTSQEAAAVTCCDCPPEACAAPRIECESEAATLCGITPNDVGVLTHPTAGEREILYATCTYSGSSTYTTSPRNDSETHSITYTREPAAVIASGSCEYGRVNGTFSGSLSNVFPPPDDAQTQALETRSGSVNAVDSGSGTTMNVTSHVIEYNTDGSVFNEYDDTPTTRTIDFLSVASLVSGASWTGGVLTYSGYDGRFAVDSEGPQTVSLTDAYSAATAAAAISAALEDIDPWTGTACVSELNVTFAADETRITAADGVKSRFRIAPPEEFSTVENPRSTFEVQWDYVLFPADPEVEPSLVSSESWIWPGDMEDPWSDFFTIPVPTIPGEIRRVNMMVLCYRSAKRGQKPTSIGEVYEIPT